MSSAAQIMQWRIRVHRRTCSLQTDRAKVADRFDNRLDALEAFIERQKSLLLQQQHDIDKLKRLKVRAQKGPTAFVANLEHEVRVFVGRV